MVLSSWDFSLWKSFFEECDRRHDRGLLGSIFDSYSMALAAAQKPFSALWLPMRSLYVADYKQSLLQCSLNAL